MPIDEKFDSSSAAYRVMAGLEPAIYRGTVLEEMAGSRPAMT